MLFTVLIWMYVDMNIAEFPSVRYVRLTSMLH
jgi:hypothetical protein